LARVSEQTGGRGEIEPSAVFDPDDLRAGRSRVALAGWFLLAAALAWPVAVALSRLALSGSVARSVGQAGAASLWWLRSRVPALPGRTPVERPARRAGSRGARPTSDAPPAGGASSPGARAGEAAPAESLGALLASQRRRRGVAGDDGDGDGDADARTE
ncbi:MAG: hypothetical protein JXA83_01525, partial [Acidimicrobiales bacterium]|nr:hypothetical protein [Acidimicrobiales bacterium]